MTTPYPLGLTAEALAAATAEPDPDSLAASVRLRERFGPELAAAAVTQVLLRRRATTKFGSAAAGLFLTRDGLEQATRPEVARHRAARLVAAGADRVVDLGCGIGTDAMAMLRAGLAVVAVERDPETARAARANLAGLGTGAVDVRTGSAEQLWPELAASGTAVFCDPARRTTRGRSWRVEDLSPPWPFVLDLLAGDRVAVVKLGPGLSRRLIPEQVEAEWLSSRGDTVELALWAGPGATPGQRSAVRVETGSRLVTDPSRTEPELGEPGGFLYEPAGAVLRSGGLATLAERLGARALHPDVAYLTADESVTTEWATEFAIESAFPYREKALRSWVARADIGILEIKTRGLELDPAALRRRLKLRGHRSATVVLTRTGDGPTAFVVRRVRIP
jgi:SAM-dependent methyltransferase